MAGRRRTSSTKQKQAVKSTAPKKRAKETQAGFSDYFRFSESYTSLILGIVVVIIASILLISFLKGREFGKTPPPAPEISSTSIGPELTPTISPETSETVEEVSPTQPASLTPTNGVKPSAQPQQGVKGTTYTVQAGDDLWHIAEKVYNDGYKWTLIAQANNISNPGMIFRGDVLKVPSASSAPSQQPEQGGKGEQIPSQQAAISGNRYTIRRGDTLWSIAERRYKNGYRWVDIARANNLANPNLIFADNILQLPQ